MDLTTTTTSWGIDSQDWLASRFGLDTGRSITLDVSRFNRDTHYPDGFLRSGIPLLADAHGLYGPASATDCDGHLLKRVHVGGDAGKPLAERVGGALLWQGVIDTRFLPVPITAAARAAAQGIRYENAEA